MLAYSQLYYYRRCESLDNIKGKKRFLYLKEKRYTLFKDDHITHMLGFRRMILRRFIDLNI
jgi:hypothetical protein